VPARLRGSAGDEGAAFLASILEAFPDLRVRTRSRMGTDDQAVIEVTMEGTQGADFLGIDNQEKHIDVDQAWMFRASDGTITAVKAYWCQNQLYRRLGVKRLDEISISNPRKA
jgi:ketosteroid isomerase-like protein